MARIVLLPRVLEDKSNRLAELENEVNGVLLYRPQGQYCPLETMFMTGVGDACHVRAEPQRIDVVNAFFRAHHDYKLVKFHTHSRGTIRKAGEYFATNFSGGDISSYQEQLSHDPDFIGMLVTPVTKLLYAPDSPELRVIVSFAHAVDQMIQGELEQIARSMGCDIGSFEARLRTT